MILDFERASIYCRNLFEIEDDNIKKIKEEAINDNIPIITDEILNFMLFLANSINAKNILEIGTATGYSGIFLSEICKENKGKLTTIEIDETRYLKAIENFKKTDMLKYVEHINGDANIVLENLNKKFDFIFIDAAKSKYGDFFEKSFNLLEDGGYVFIDNIMFRGYIFEDDIPKRYKSIKKNLTKFITKLNNEYNFVLLPFGDGVGIVKK